MVAVNQKSDVTIYIEGEGVSFTVRYEVTASLNSENLNTILTRLRKSFNLNRNTPDAYTELAILRKAELMKTIFRTEYGLSATIVDLIAR